MKRRVVIAAFYLLAWIILGFFAPIRQPTDQELECLFGVTSTLGVCRR